MPDTTGPAPAHGLPQEPALIITGGREHTPQKETRHGERNDQERRQQ